MAFNALAQGAGAPPPPPSPAEELLGFLNQTVDWYRQVSTLDQTALDSQELLYRDAAEQNARQALRLAFDYARAQARLLTEQSAATRPAANQSSKLTQAAQAANQRVAQIQAELDKISQQLNSGPADATVLTAQRDKLAAELNLAKARQQVVQNLMGVMSGADGSSDTLLQKIDALEGSVPDAQSANAPSAKSANASAAAAPARPESIGVLGLISQMFTLSNRMSELKDLAGKADKLSAANEKLRQPIRTELVNAIHRGDVLSTTQPSNDVAKLAADRAELEGLSTRFTQLGGAGVPLGGQGMAINATKTALLEWRAALSKQYTHALRSILIRVGAIGITVFALLLISTFWKRATYRYVAEPRHRAQLLLIRRVVIGCVIVLVIAGGVVTELSSLMTFAGLITAGIAVALQGVILSGAAYFFFIGRYGVRVGDRVTISGTTGDVIETGLLRLYLMELGGSGRDLNPTGRIVVFSNSVLFQNAPFYKQIPGADYVWHEVALTLSPDSDYRLAESRLMEAVESVFNEYKQNIERQYANVQRSMQVQLSPPRPQGRMRLVEAGLEFVVRYPVEIGRAGEINDRITRKLLETIDQEPSLRLVSSGTPRIQAAEDRPHAA
jgi:small-conductance mechanosensitive channel